MYMFQNDPDYSCAYVELKTDGGLSGFGLTFTTGKGTELGELVNTEMLSSVLFCLNSRNVIFYVILFKKQF